MLAVGWHTAIRGLVTTFYACDQRELPSTSLAVNQNTLLTANAYIAGFSLITVFFALGPKDLGYSFDKGLQSRNDLLPFLVKAAPRRVRGARPKLLSL